MCQKLFSLWQLLVLLPFFFIACSEDPSSLGKDLLGQDDIIVSKLDSYADTLNQKFEPHHAKLSLGASDVLLVGKDANVESQILLAFSLAVTDKYLTNFDSLTFISADISLTRNYYFGDTLQPFNVGIHQITSSWNSLFTADSLSKLTYDQASVVQSTNISSNAYSFSVNPNLAKEWFKAAKDTSSAKNYGVLFKPTGLSRFTGFAASTSLNSDVPTIKIVVKKATAYESYQDTLTYNGSVDVHIIQGTFPEANNKTLTIQSGAGVQGTLWFDLSKLPADAVVNTAKLTLSIDTLNMKVGSSYSDGLVAYQIADSVSDSTTASFVISLPRSGNTYSGDVARIINNAILTKNNYGMLITSPYQVHGIENFALFNSTAANNELKPRLVITYSQKKK
ncbi:MAG: DNRLRE domain-containing protein [Ignavibacteriaceae bacterium]|jgi:hypothetical protein